MDMDMDDSSVVLMEVSSGGLLGLELDDTPWACITLFFRYEFQ